MNSTPAAISREPLRGEVAGLKNDWVAVDPKRKVVATDSMSRIDVEPTLPIATLNASTGRIVLLKRSRRKYRRPRQSRHSSASTLRFNALEQNFLAP
jgi:hypothetical protein